MEISEEAMLRALAKLARDAGILRLPDLDEIDDEVRRGIIVIEKLMRSIYGDSSEYWSDAQIQDTYRGLIVIRDALHAYRQECAVVNSRIMHTTPIPQYEAAPKAGPDSSSADNGQPARPRKKRTHPPKQRPVRKKAKTWT